MRRSWKDSSAVTGALTVARFGTEPGWPGAPPPPWASCSSGSGQRLLLASLFLGTTRGPFTGPWQPLQCSLGKPPGYQATGRGPRAQGEALNHVAKAASGPLLPQAPGIRTPPHFPLLPFQPPTPNPSNTSELWGSQHTSVQFSRSVMSNFLRPHGLQHAKLPCPSPTPELAQTQVRRVGDAIQASHLLSSPSPPAFNLVTTFSNKSVLCIRWPKGWSFSFGISPSNEYSGLISFRMDWFESAHIEN